MENKDIITKGDFLKWYNSEINRYRDHEWQIATFSIGVSIAILIFALNKATKTLINPITLCSVIFVFMLLMVFTEIHTHFTLNGYRERRDLLLKGKEHYYDDKYEKIKINPSFASGLIDGIYIVAFLAAQIFSGFFAINTILFKYFSPMCFH